MFDEAAREKVLCKEGAGAALTAGLEALESVEPFTHEAIEGALREIPALTGLKPKVAFQSMRVAIMGTTVSPPLFESLELLGRERTLARIRAALPLAAS